MSPRIKRAPDADKGFRSLLVWKTPRGVVGEVRMTPKEEPLRLRLSL